MSGPALRAASRAAVGALLLGLAAGVGWPLLQIRLGSSALADGDPLSAEGHFASAMTIPLPNGWLAPYGRGLARLDLSRWDASAADLERAAGSAPDERQCGLRLAWARALEGGADELRASDDLAGANVRYQQAIVVLAEADCSPQTIGGSSGLADELAEARERLAGSTSAGSPAEGSQDSGDNDPLDELDARTEQAQFERQRAVSDGGRDSGGNGERTW